IHAAGSEATLRPWHPRHVVVRRGQSCQTGVGRRTPGRFGRLDRPAPVAHPRRPDCAHARGLFRCAIEKVRPNRMIAYILRRILLIIPPMRGIMLVTFVIVQFAPGGPVERLIAQLTGTDPGATAMFSGGGG